MPTLLLEISSTDGNMAMLLGLLYIGAFVLSICMIVSFFQMKAEIKKQTIIHEEQKVLQRKQLELMACIAEVAGVPSDDVNQIVGEYNTESAEAEIPKVMSSEYLSEDEKIRRNIK